MAENYPVNIPSGLHMLPRASGSNNLGSASYPFLNYYGGTVIPYRLVSGVNYTAGYTDQYIDVNTTGGARIITLPTAVGYAGKEYQIRKITADANQVIVSGTSSQTFNGDRTKEILYQYSSMGVLSNGTNWILI